MDATDDVFARLRDILPTFRVYWNDLFSSRAPGYQFHINAVNNWSSNHRKNFTITIRTRHDINHHTIWEMGQLDIIEENLTGRLRNAIAAETHSMG